MEPVKRQVQENCFSLFGKDGVMKPVMKIVGNLPRGMKVVYHYFAGNTATYGALGDGRLVLMSSVVDDCFDDEFFNFTSYMSDADSNPIEEEFGIGLYYCENEEGFTEEELQAAIANAEIREINRKKYQEEQENASKKEVVDLKKKYSYLTIKTKDTTTRDETNNVRKVLKKEFPTTKFSVRYESFSGGDACRISWTDGPKEEDVRPVVKMFQDHHSDWSGDYWDYDPSNFNRLFGGFKFVSTSRDISEEKIDEVSQKVLNEVPAFLLRKTYQEARGLKDNDNKENLEKVLDETAKSNLEQSMKEKIYRVCNDVWKYDTNLHDVVSHWLRDQDLQTKEEPKEAQTEHKEANLQIVDYSEKAIAVIGDTKSVKDELKALGGKFNFRLTCGAGWIFSKTKESEIRKTFGI